MNPSIAKFAMCIFLIATLLSCKEKKAAPSQTIITNLELKKGQLVTCGPEDKQFGSVNFKISNTKTVQEDFNLGVTLLHSFEYDEAEKVFARIIEKQPDCAMAFWGVAMANFHPLWAPPSPEELKKGNKAIDIARMIKDLPERELAYIDAISAYYKDHEHLDHHSRCLKFEQQMESIHKKYPTDKEAAIFYALALTAAADPADKTFAKQKRAGALLASIYPDQPDHPGIVHYTIHSYDSPELAALALPAARKYASVAPSSAHALHMPSHIFTRLGLWDECIQSNLASVASAKCYAETTKMKGHWDEELHGIDYLVYAYLQKGESALALKQWQYLQTFTSVEPLNFKVTYAFAAVPSRIYLENKLWEEASKLKLPFPDIPWENYPWQKGIIHFTRIIGAIHTGNRKLAAAELQELKNIHTKLAEKKELYSAAQVAVQINTAEAWINFRDGDQKNALVLMQLAADMEDKTEKHPVTPGPVIPAREFLGDLLMEMKAPRKALEAYERNLAIRPNRFNSLYGAGNAAEQSGDYVKAKQYYSKLLNIVDKANVEREELVTAKIFLQKHITSNY